MYKKIINPVSGRLVNVKGSVGRKVLKNYMYQSQSGGGLWDTINPFADNPEEQEVKRVESNQNKAADAIKTLEQRLSHIKESITLSIIGCVVNGPGEAAHTDIGITGGGKDSSMLYLKGVQTEKINNDKIISKIVALVEERVKILNDKK